MDCRTLRSEEKFSVQLKKQRSGPEREKKGSSILRGRQLWSKQFCSLLHFFSVFFRWHSRCPFPCSISRRSQVCTSERRRDKEPVLLEGRAGGAAEQHKPSTALDYCFPSAHLGVAARSGGPDAGRGRGPQAPALNAPPRTPRTSSAAPFAFSSSVSAFAFRDCGWTNPLEWRPGPVTAPGRFLLLAT